MGLSVTRYLAMALAGVVALIAAYLWGRVDGTSAGRIEQLEDTIMAHETRGKIDEDVGAADRYSLCIDLRGLPEQCDELRRMDEAAKPE